MPGFTEFVHVDNSRRLFGQYIYIIFWSEYVDATEGSLCMNWFSESGVNDIGRNYFHFRASSARVRLVLEGILYEPGEIKTDEG